MNKVRHFEDMVRDLIATACELTQTEGNEERVIKLKSAVELMVDSLNLDEHFIDEFDMDVSEANNRERKEMPIVIYFDPQGPSGNIYAILGQCQQELRKRHRITDFNNLREAVFASGSYDEALKNVRQYVTLIERAE